MKHCSLAVIRMSLSRKNDRSWARRPRSYMYRPVESGGDSGGGGESGGDSTTGDGETRVGDNAEADGEEDELCE